MRRAKRGVLVLLLLGQPKAGHGGMCAERSEVCWSFYYWVSRRLSMVVCVPSEARCAGPFISRSAEGWSWWYLRLAKRGVLLLLLLGPAEGWPWWYVCLAKLGVLVLLLVGQPKAGHGGMCAERSEAYCSFYYWVSLRLARVVCVPSVPRCAAPLIVGQPKAGHGGWRDDCVKK